MPEANQIIWTHKELITLMVKAANIHEGRWMLVINYGMSPGNFGPSDAEISPGMIVAVTGLGIQRELSGQTAPSTLVVDAAEINPRPSSTVSSQPSSQPPPDVREASSPPSPSRPARPTPRRRS